jgi:predicted short-subunit dehydrogenase-like oxidoreductase (DUF2520 family)
MNIEIHGVGRAGGAIAIAAHRSGHRIVGLESRSRSSLDAVADHVTVQPGAPDLRIVAVADDAIPEVAAGLLEEVAVPTVHVSGSVSIEVMSKLRDAGVPIGSFHPLQTLPNPVTGAECLPGSWIAITCDVELAEPLRGLAESLGARAFAIADADKATYHAAAAATANFPLASLALAKRLYEAAGVPFEASRPLLDAVIDNAYAMGPDQALTGPIARGDAGTVRAQRTAVAAEGEDAERAFVHFARGTAVVAAASDAVTEELA